MKLLADEGIDRQIVNRLRGEGHDVSYIAELHPGLRDEGVLALSNDLNAVLLTADKDFGELVYRDKLAHVGVLLLRLEGMRPLEKATLVSRVLAGQPGMFAHRFSVLTEKTLRARRIGD